MVGKIKDWCMLGEMATEPTGLVWVWTRHIKFIMKTILQSSTIHACTCEHNNMLLCICVGRDDRDVDDAVVRWW